MEFDKEQGKAALKGVKQKIGRIDGYVNNVGVNDVDGPGNSSYEEFIFSMDQKTDAQCMITTSALPALTVKLLSLAMQTKKVLVSECFTPQDVEWLLSFPNPEEKWDEISQWIPLGKRMTTPEEITRMVFLLAKKSDHNLKQLVFTDGWHTHLDRDI